MSSLIPDIAASSQWAEWWQALECRGCEMSVRAKVVDNHVRLISHKECPLENKQWKKHCPSPTPSIRPSLTIPSHHRHQMGGGTKLRTSSQVNPKTQHIVVRLFLNQPPPTALHTAMPCASLTFPFLDFQLTTLEALVVGLGLRLVIWVVVL